MGWAARANRHSNEFARLSPEAQALVQAQESREFSTHSPEAEELTDQQRLRELAGQITTEAQLQRILDDVQPQSLRGEVEAQIRPWCAFTAPVLLGPDSRPVRPEPLVTVTPTDPADAESAAVLEAAINHEVRGDLLANEIRPAQRPVFGCTCNRYGCQASLGHGPCDEGAAFARGLTR